MRKQFSIIENTNEDYPRRSTLEVQSDGSFKAIGNIPHGYIFNPVDFSIVDHNIAEVSVREKELRVQLPNGDFIEINNLVNNETYLLLTRDLGDKEKQRTFGMYVDNGNVYAGEADKGEDFDKIS